jgi:hypothetical protein
VAYPQIAAFARLANGGVAPVRSMAGQATQISRTGHNVVYDPVNDEIWHTNPEAQAVLAFRGSANGEEAPIRVIQGPHTMMAFPTYGLGVDAVNNEVYVVEKEYITVYPRTAKGDVAPTRIIRGPHTELLNARAILVDTVRNILLVGTNNGIVIFDRTASGDATPRAVISGSESGIRTMHARKAGDVAGLSEAELAAYRSGNSGVAVQSMAMSKKYFVMLEGGGRGADEPAPGASAAQGADNGSGAGRGGVRGPGGGPGGACAWSLDALAAAHGKVDMPPDYVLSDPSGVLAGGKVTLNPNGKEVIIGQNKLSSYSFPEIF